ncbi:HDL082Wp [Eremothecium sinecaudum]|uniref:Cytochrome b-c1 complex subunit 6, mitochondrial n=1 Tax=Eremothecium sinecaudum TaxID=45286 RepID=A0A0X8HSF5_9SACH|nr:HDL082Wp [Eremothecium sinecaudum]AMD20662.1 HDL082Wp [Eremothecium sinecaudum]
MVFSITEYLEELKEAMLPTVARAEDDVEDVEDNEEGDGEEEDDDDEDDDEDGDDEDGETVDQLDALRAECKETAEAKPLVHHYMECVERVHAAQEQPGYEDLDYKEDCVEEFFHLQHYLDQCAAPRLFDRLK